MDDTPRQKLCELIATYGRSLCDDPRRCDGLLRDFCGQYRREIFVLVSALRERVVADLLTASDGIPKEILLTRLTQRLQDHLSMVEGVARWGVESWALALGQISNAECRMQNREAPKPLRKTPVGKDSDNPFASLPTSSPEEQLRRAVRTVLADAWITELEKSELQGLCDHLRIPSDRARQIFTEVKEEMALAQSISITPKKRRPWKTVGVVAAVALTTVVSAALSVQWDKKEWIGQQTPPPAQADPLTQSEEQKAVEEEQKRQAEEAARQAEKERRLAELIELEQAQEAQRKAEEEKQAGIGLQEQKQGSESTLAPGQYKVIRATAVLKEPDRNATVIARLRVKQKVKVVGVAGDYVRVVSTHGRPPGYVYRNDIVPLPGQKATTAPVLLKKNMS